MVERQAIGEDIQAMQFRWPLEMPLVRTQLPMRIARVLFTVQGGELVLLHGFIKKTQAIPQTELWLAESRVGF